MNTYWYLVKVLPGKERQLAEEFNRQINLEKIKNINRFVCPTEKQLVIVKKKNTIREKVLYSGYLYFEAPNQLEEDELKTISMTQNIMSMGNSKLPILLRKSDVDRILKDDVLEKHIESKTFKFKINEPVLIIDGPFKTFKGTVTQLKENDKVEIEVMIFERSTTLILDAKQLEKI
jgi:transcriptional antiterminator NusG